MLKVPFNQVDVCLSTINDLSDCFERGIYERGLYAEKAISTLKQITSSKEILLTSSCTAALEISALLSNIGPNDEVIMPSFTFVSTANAFVLRGAKPVFVDINPYTLNIDESKIEEVISYRTKAIVPVHYAGEACSMNKILSLAKKYNLTVIEDAAQCIGSKYEHKHLGTLGHMGCLSFHYTKNITAGFGGALLINSPALFSRAKILAERGTNRDLFLNGEVTKYTWVDLGSSYVMDELKAAILANQLKNLDVIQKKRIDICLKYHQAFESLEKHCKAKRFVYPENSPSNGHLYFLVLSEEFDRTHFIKAMKEKGIQLTSHYQPLHLSPYYLEKFSPCSLPVTEKISQKIVRFPVYPSLTQDMQNYTIEQTLNYFKSIVVSINNPVLGK